MPSGRSPGLSRYAPSTGTAVSATTSDAISAKLTVIANGKKNAPTSPSMKASGRKTTIVVSVDAVIAGPTSTVASSAARHRSLPPSMLRYTFSSTTMLSSTTLPTDIASPPSVMKFRASPCQLMSSTPMNMLRGIDKPITTVGRSVLRTPMMTDGLSVRKNRNTTEMASVSPRMASRSRVEICDWMSGPWSLKVTISAPFSSPRILASASWTPVVTSIVLASGCLTTAILMLGWPFVLDMLVGMPDPSVTSATSPSVTACLEPAEGACPEPAERACPEPVEGACPALVEGACAGGPDAPGPPAGIPPNAAGLLTTSPRRSSSDE